MEPQPTSSGSDTELFRPLPKAPSALSLTVRKLITRVSEGAVRVPRFQRPLRWTGQDVLKLFDSILKGYPIGALLFWKRPFPASQVVVGQAAIDVPQVDDGWYIVDGQQRTTALAAALLDLNQQADLRWQLYFDPDKNRFLPAASSELIVERHVPLSALGDIRRLGRWVRDHEVGEKTLDHIERVQQRLLDYEIPAYVLDTDEEDSLRGVFARLNSTGVRMRADEVFQALLGSGDGGPSAKRRSVDLGRLQVAADVDGFGEPPRAEVLKALLAMSGIDPTRRLEDLEEGSLRQLVGQEEAEEAVMRAAAFLLAPPDAAEESGCGIPAYAFIPYPVVFVLLTRWFHLFPDPAPEIRRTLAQWVWRGITTAVHQRAAVSALRLQVRRMRPDRPEESLRALLDAVGEPDGREWKLEPFHSSHASSRVEILALLAQSPRTRLGPVSWRALLSSGSRVAREIFALPMLEEGARVLGRTAANRALLDARHTGLAAELRRWTGSEDRATLDTHLIDAEAFELLRANQRREFLERRAARLRAVVASLLADRAGLGKPLVFPVEEYLDHGETEE